MFCSTGSSGLCEYRPLASWLSPTRHPCTSLRRLEAAGVLVVPGGLEAEPSSWRLHLGGSCPLRAEPLSRRKSRSPTYEPQVPRGLQQVCWAVRVRLGALVVFGPARCPQQCACQAKRRGCPLVSVLHFM